MDNNSDYFISIASDGGAVSAILRALQFGTTGGGNFSAACSVLDVPFAASNYSVVIEDALTVRKS
jgi:hypothetical protein